MERQTEKHTDRKKGRHLKSEKNIDTERYRKRLHTHGRKKIEKKKRKEKRGKNKRGREKDKRSWRKKKKKKKGKTKEEKIGNMLTWQ